MRLNALVMCRDAATVRGLVAAFAEFGIEYQISFSPSETMEIMVQSRHSALVVDFDLRQAVQVSTMARALPRNNRPVVFGLIGANTAIADLFEAGGHFALCKPLDSSQVLHSLRAALAFMQQDRRSAARQKGEALAYLDLAGGAVPALVHDLTEEGLSVQAAETLAPLRGLSMRFLLPGTGQVVHAIGDLVWTDREGRAGMYFTSIAPACRRDLQAWLRKRELRKPKAPRPLYEVRHGRRPTVEAQ